MGAIIFDAVGLVNNVFRRASDIAVLYWICAILAYLSKFAIKEWDLLTSYGKLQPARPGPASGSANQKRARIPLGRLIDLGLSEKSAWTSFYAVGWLVNALLALAAWRRISSTEVLGGPHTDAVLTAVLLQVQLSRRTGECLLVHIFSPRSMNLVNHAAGLSFYVFLSLSVLAPLLEDDAQRAKAVGDPKVWLRRLIGLALFMWGSVQQNRLHRILADLRKAPASVTASTNSIEPSIEPSLSRYCIPHGSWFELVSSPHYLAELILYAGLLVISGGRNLPMWLACTFVFVNLSDGARRTHQWYRAKFDNYPKTRRALIPFVF